MPAAIVCLLAALAANAGETPVCALCMDAPEMFEHRESPASRSAVIETISADDLEPTSCLPEVTGSKDPRCDVDPPADQLDAVEAPEWGTMVRILSGGTDCLISDDRVPCAEIAEYLGVHVALSDPITVFFLAGDAVTAAQQASVASVLKEAGFTRVAIGKVGFMTERDNTSQGGR